MSDPYAKERYNPALRHCEVKTGQYIRIRFDGKHLKLVGGSTTKSYVAASGKKLDGVFDYSGDRQKVKNAGPIPAGVYWIRPDELWTNAWYKRASTAAWGNFRITIHPFPSTETFGRGGFFIHGGDDLGSAGCIDLVKNMDAFVKDLREMLGDQSRCQIHVEVKYV